MKSEFDAACADVEDFSDRSSTSFRTAQDLYRTWIKAIDGAALALLDDLDALDRAQSDATKGSSFSPVYSPVEAMRPGEVDHVFAEIDDALQARAIVSASDDDNDNSDLFGE
ncbi:hypothetical protein [Lichenifustis flavocetrariae]|uniref:Uncharacterized protein n=1 Tax=Lichenifustis flavocetrariae TaxID=2949735 RepID=A0AA42CQG3_9HYPH|nr:hypothetical protein [Lichenifustis flavocetrariae]MCW6511420.1 hypothetical protein [Lichenifustis flavocetrariae]